MCCLSVACGMPSPNAVSNAIGYAKHRSRSADAVIRVYDSAGLRLRLSGDRDRAKIPGRQIDRESGSPQPNTNPKRNRGFFPLCRKILRRPSLTRRVGLEWTGRCRAREVTRKSCTKSWAPLHPPRENVDPLDRGGHLPVRSLPQRAHTGQSDNRSAMPACGVLGVAVIG